ncbi:MAG: phosphomannomutase/phosphoglucomutase [Planctomycetota bacterium]
MGIFKAYDIRGVFGSEITLETAERIGRAYAEFLKPRRVAVGRDMRDTGPEVKAALVRGLNRGGCDVADIGETSTPMSYFAVGNYGLDGAVQVTASHNPAKYTGFKLSREEAIPISGDTGIKAIQELVEAGPLPDAEKPGEVEELPIRDDYVRHVLSFARDLKPMKIAVDAANGMGGLEVELVFPHLPVELVPLYLERDGTFPNHEPNPLRVENLEDLIAKVVETGAAVGVGLDGDADRACFVDELGQPVTNDLTTALIAMEILPSTPGPVVYDLRSSRVLPETILAHGGTPIRERVGHAFLKATMRRENAVFGGEFSGHYYFRENFNADSAIIAVVKVLNVLSQAERPFSELLVPLRRYPMTGETNFEVEDKDAKIEEIAEVFSDGEVDFVDGVTVQYPDWWFNVRKSNTEPLLRLNLEGMTQEAFEEGRERVMKLLGTPVDK